jgi:uncharacterized protein (DUF305 family)
MKWLLPIRAAALAAVIAAAPAFTAGAGEMNGPMHNMHDMMDMPGMGDDADHGDDSPSSLAFEGANAKMHRDMAITYTGDADFDFVRGMIPHHRGAIDMAKIVLAFGKDPEIRKLAQDIVTAQESEIAVMETWLKQHGK